MKFDEIMKRLNLGNIQITLLDDERCSDRTCEVRRNEKAIIVNFPCNQAPMNELSYAYSIANSCAWYKAYPSERLYCDASGEEPSCFRMVEQTYKAMLEIFNNEELEAFCDAFGD